MRTLPLCRQSTDTLTYWTVVFDNHPHKTNTQRLMLAGIGTNASPFYDIEEALKNRVWAANKFCNGDLSKVVIVEHTIKFYGE